MNKVPKMPATEVEVSWSGKQGANGLSLDRTTSAAPSSDSTSTNGDSANPMQHHRLSGFHPTQTTNPPVDPLPPCNPHVVLHDASLVNVEGPPQNAGPSYPYPLAIRTCTGIHFIPETTDREEIAAFVEKAHFILTPEMERKLAALDLELLLLADHVDTQPQQAIDVKHGAPSTTSSRGKGALKRVWDETVEVGDKREGPAKKMRSNTPRGVTAQGDVTATAEHQPEHEPLDSETK